MSEAHRRIIVVDDDAETRALLKRQLGEGGYEVQAFGDGRAALEPISEMGSGLVIADWLMPVMDGLELCRSIRELEEMQALGSIYYILLSALTSKDKTVEGLGAGANDYLTKPYDADELLARIHVGERFIRLQEELRRQTVEFQKANLELLMLSRRLDELANTDVLTGLANRRCILERLSEAWAAAVRSGQPLCCVMLDVDRFKKINDTYGHEAGDAVLKAVATRIRSTSRRSDMCGRLGGEEFLVVLPNCPRDGAASVAERIRGEVSAKPVAYGETVIPVTISCGVAERTPREVTPGALMRQADDLLYAAKDGGRNQTWVLDPDGRTHAVMQVALSVAE
jgi:diguanylate cyclase (GGDEF)-like protein